MSYFLQKLFKLDEKKTNVRTELLAGLTTFVTMVYILAVNPSILAEAGMDSGAVFTATILATIIATLAMAFLSNYPFALSAGMGLNAYFTFSVVIGQKVSFHYALCAVFIEGLLFILLTFVKARESIVNSIPLTLKAAVAVGIGLFISFIGLKSAQIIVANPLTFVELGDLRAADALVCLVGLVVAVFLLIKRIPGALLLGVMAATVVGIPLGVTKWPTQFFSLPPSIAPTFMAFRDIPWSEILSFKMFGIVLTFLFVDLFDTIGMLVGTASKANMLDEKGRLPGVSRALFADALGTTVGAVLGTSTVTTFAESAAGIAEGGRSGLTGVVTSILFALALFFSPIFLAIPASATASALIIVGLFMIDNIHKVRFDDYTEAVPAFLTMIMMPLTYSIGNGLMIGIIAYPLCKILAGRAREASVVMYILAVIFLLKIFFLGV